MFTNDMTSITSVIGQTEYWRNICQIMAGSTFKFSVACYVLFACIRLLFYIRLWKCNFASFFHSLFCCSFDYSVGFTFSAIFCVKLPRYLRSQNSPLLSCNAMSSGNNFPKFWSILLFLWSRCKEMETESFSKIVQTTRGHMSENLYLCSACLARPTCFDFSKHKSLLLLTFGLCTDFCLHL